MYIYGSACRRQRTRDTYYRSVTARHRRRGVVTMRLPRECAMQTKTQGTLAEGFEDLPPR